MDKRHKHDSPDSRYLVHFRIGGDDVDKSRAREVFTGLAAAMKDISCGKCQMAYSSHDTGTFSFLVKTSLTPGEIRNTITRIPGNIMKSSLILKDDQYMILQLGTGGFSIGFGPAMTWLQHN